MAYGAAERVGATVTVIRVREPPNDDSSAYLESAVQRFTDTAPTQTLMLDGPPAERLLEASAGSDTTLCLATHGRSGLSRIVLGSVADEIVRRSVRPVIVVGPRGAATPLQSERARMIVCTDGSPAAAPVLPATAEFAAELDLTCSVVQVAAQDEDVSLDDLPPVRPHYERALLHNADACEYLASMGIAAEPIVLRGDPARAIAHRATLEHASFIAVATHGRSGLTRATLGSTASDIVRRAPCPVFVARTDQGHSS